MTLNSKLLVFLSFLFFSINLSAQDDNIKFVFTNLGSFNSDYTYGGYDGGLGKLKAEILEYTYLETENSVRIQGEVTDFQTNESFCEISIFLAIAEPYYKRMKNRSYLEMNILNIKNTYLVDCAGNFDIIIDLDQYDKFYFGIIGYSLLECTVVHF